MLFHFRVVPLTLGMNLVAMELDQDGQIAIQEEKLFKCSICEDEFAKNEELAEHISSVHEEKNPIDGWRNPVAMELDQDGQIAIQEGQTSDILENDFTLYDSKNHISAAHEEKKAQNYSSKMVFEEMRAHFSSVHEEKKPQDESMKKLFKCSICEDEFAKIEELAEHISSVHEEKNPIDWMVRPPKGQLISE